MCVCMRVPCGVSFCMCMYVGLRVLWLPLVTCVGHVLSLPGWGRRRRSWETAEHKGDSDRQAGRQQANGLPGRLGPHPKAAQFGGRGRGVYPFGMDCTYCRDALVFNHVLPPTHASLFPSFTPTPTIPDPQATLKPLPYVVSLKSNLHLSSMASNHETSSHLEKRFPTVSHLLPPLLQPGHQTHKRALTEVVHSHAHSCAWVLFLSPCYS